MKRRLLHILFLILILNKGFGQDPHFSQFFSSPLYLSPSLSGAGNGTRFILNYRNQWPSIQDAYINYAFSVDHYFKEYNSGVGFLALRDEEGGVYGTNAAAATYTYTIRINNQWSINPGVLFSYNNNFLDWNKLEFGDQIYRDANSTVELMDNDLNSYFDFNNSLMVYSEKIWFGVTAAHMMNINPKISLEEGYPPLKFSVYGGTKIYQKSKSVTVSDNSYTLAFIYKNQNSYHQLDLGAYYERDFLRVGTWLRGSRNVLDKVSIDAAVFLAGFSFEQFKFNYSYDISTSRLMSLTGGAHEISILYSIMGSNHKKNKHRKMVPCPEF